MNPYEAAQRIVAALEEFIDARAAVDPLADFDARDIRDVAARDALVRVIEKALSA
jgi:hypothetical protein